MKQAQYSISTPVSDRDSHVRGDLTVCSPGGCLQIQFLRCLKNTLILSVQLSESSHYNTKTSMSVAANVRPLVAKKTLASSCQRCCHRQIITCVSLLIIEPKNSLKQLFLEFMSGGRVYNFT